MTPVFTWSRTLCVLNPMTMGSGKSATAIKYGSPTF
jgi:hypothetical protein